jgi:hypothetical protein
MSTGRNNADIYPQTRTEPYVSSYIATAIYHCFFKANKSLGVLDSRFLAQMSPEFICLMATALQWHLHTYVATGKAVQALLFNSINAGGE